MRKILFFILVMVFSFTGIAWGIDYHVDATRGNDSWSGTLPEPNGNLTNGPWKTIAKVNSASFSAGDRILFKRGEIWRKAISVSNSGAEQMPIIYGSYGAIADKPIIDGDSTIDNCIKFKNGIKYIRIEGLSLKDTFRSVVYLSDAKHVVIQNCDLSLSWARDPISEHSKIRGNDNYDITIRNNKFSGLGYLIDFWAGYSGNPPNKNDVSDITISDNEFVGVNFNGLSKGIRFHTVGGGTPGNYGFEGTCHDIIISKNTFRNIGSHAIWFSMKPDAVTINGNPGVQAYNITIDDNFSEKTDWAFACIGGTRADYGENYISRNIVIQAGFEDYQRGVDGIMVHQAHNMTIEHNIVSETGSAGPGDGNGIILDHLIRDAPVEDYACEGVIIRYNVCINSRSPKAAVNGPAGISVWRGKNSQIYGNVCYGNIVGIKTAAELGGNIFYNNTLVNNDEGVLLRGHDYVKQVFENNIIAHNKIYGFHNTGTVLPDEQYNLVYNNGDNFHSPKHAGWDGDSTDIGQDPLFVNYEGGDFHLTSDSPAINSGIDVGLLYDFDGVSVPQGSDPDIGAYEFTGSNYTTIPLPSDASYGNIKGGDQSHIDEINYNFGGLSGDVMLYYEAWDVDNADEVQIILNGTHIGYAAKTTNDSWGGVQGISLPDALVNDSSYNYLTFNNTNNPPNQWYWGVRYVSVGETYPGNFNLLLNGNFETDNNLDGNPDNWITIEPVELDGNEKVEGSYSVRLESEVIINNINRQYVELEPNTTYLLSAWIKTEGVTGEGAQVYPYDYGGANDKTKWIRVKGSTDWTSYSMEFTTGGDPSNSRINFRLKRASGLAWFDDIRLVKLN